LATRLTRFASKVVRFFMICFVSAYTINYVSPALVFHHNLKGVLTSVNKFLLTKSLSSRSI
jgi:hypothetical protein